MAQRPQILILAGALACFAAGAWAQADSGRQAAPATPQIPYADPPVKSGIDNRAEYLGREFITSRSAQVWRASDLVGTDVRSREDESAGEVDDLLVDPAGRVLALVVRFGGLLGIGQSRVAVPMDAVSVLGSAPHAATGDPRGTAGIDPNARRTTSPDTPPMVGDRGTDDVPLRVVVNLTRAELEGAPKFEARPDR